MSRSPRPLPHGRTSKSKKPGRAKLTVHVLEDRTAPAAVSFSVGGTAQWTDSGDKTHAVQRAVVEVLEHDGAAVTVIGTGVTDLLGTFTVALTGIDDGDDTNPDVSVRVLAKSTVATVKPLSDAAEIYSLQSAVVADVPADAKTAFPALVAGKVTDNDTAFSVHSALIYGGVYAGYLTGETPPLLDVRYEAAIAGSSQRGGANPQMKIRGSAKFEWDVVLHEYGHYVHTRAGFKDVDPGAHSSEDNLSDSNASKPKGVKLAFNEGFPTWLSIAGQVRLNLSALGIAEVGNTDYESWGRGTVYSMETDGGLGEDNEKSVGAVLWDLMDSEADGVDQIALGDKGVFNTLKGLTVGKRHIGGAWEAFTAGKSNAEKAKYGDVFGQNKIAPELTGPPENEVISATAPTLTWVKNGGGTIDRLNDFKVVFYKGDFSSAIRTVAVPAADVGDQNQTTVSFKVPDEDWAAVVASGEGQVKWVVEGRNTTVPITPSDTGFYWSGARTLGLGPSFVFVVDDTGSMSEEIGAVRTGLANFIDLIESVASTPPTIQLMTFKDNVTVRLTTNDLGKMRTAVGALSASGGGDCPEASNLAVAQAAETVNAGGALMLFTDASTHPGVDMNAVTALLRSKGATLFTLLSGDCGDIESSEVLPAGMASATIAHSGDQPNDPLDCRCGEERESGSESETPPPGGTATSDDDGLPIEGPGGPVVDEHGDTNETATPLPLNSAALIGAVGGAGDAEDRFALAVEAGKRYSVTVTPNGSSFISADVLTADGTEIASGSSSEVFAFQPAAAGTVYLKLTAFGASAYGVKYTDDPLAAATSAVDLFSTMSTLTGGTFLVVDDVNSGSSTRYESAVLNVLTSTVGPAVIAANPDAVPKGQTLTVTLTGRGTNWVNGVTTVAFSNAGLAVQSVAVTSATTLSVVVAVAADTPEDLYNVTVTTPLGAATETATGKQVVEVGAEVTDPTLLSVDPGALEQGQKTTVVIRGANTAFTGSPTVTLGDGITVTAVRVVSATQIDADIEVSPGAAIGFRTAVVTLGADTLTKTRAAFVEAVGVALPVITGISPASASAGTTVAVTVTGTLTAFVAGTTAASFGPGVTVLGVNVVSPTQAVVTVRTDRTTAVGFRNVTMTTGSVSAAALNGFFVAAPSAIIPTTLVGYPEFAVGADGGGGPSVRFFNPGGTERYTEAPFAAGFSGGVRTAAADFNNDGVADAVVGTGPGAATRVRVLDGIDKHELFAVDPFEASFTGGVYVTAGDVDGDGLPDLIITPDEGGGPRVDIYSGKNFGKLASFFGIDDVNFRGGARAGTGDLNGDGTADLVVVAGFGGGPRVAGFDGKTVGGTPGRLFGDFFAFEQSLRNGIFIAVGDVDGDGTADLICGGGPGGGPRVTVFSGKALATNTYDVKANFFGGDESSRGGIRVAAKNLDGDAKADIVVGAGAGAGSRVTAYFGKDVPAAGTPPEAFAFDAFDGFTGGVFVG